MGDETLISSINKITLSKVEKKSMNKSLKI